MFYYDNGRWTPFAKKVSYTETIVDYDNDTYRFEGKDNLVVEDLALTPEELIRLETIKNVDRISLVDVIAYVKGGELRDEPSAELIQAEEVVEERKALKSLVDVNTAQVETLRKMKVLIKQYDPKAYYEKDDLVDDDGELYVVIQEHPAQDDWKPIDTPALYAPKLTSIDGTPQPWVQPGSENYYRLGDKVTHNGKLWESMVAVNTWEPGAPGVYDNIWKEVL